MPYGFGAALTWALDTVILGIALANPAFAATPQAIALAAFTSTFLHDASSAVFSFAYMGIRRKLGETWRTLRSKSGLVVVGAALIGGPIGMTGYVVAINNIGPAYTAAISAFFPAYGAALATVVLKERMRPYQWAGLAACLVAVAVLGWTPVDGVPGSWTVGIIGALVCVLGWGTEAVVIDWGLRNASVDDECAMQIRQNHLCPYVRAGNPAAPWWMAQRHRGSHLERHANYRACGALGHGVVPALLQGNRHPWRLARHGAQHYVLCLGHSLLASAAGHDARRPWRGVRRCHHPWRHHGGNGREDPLWARGEGRCLDRP